MNDPTISVVMPVYNGEKYLTEAIDSILSQTYKNFELIILNDGSTDRTEEIILSYADPRIIYIKNKDNLQLIKTLNKGLSIAKGKYIARMDADDISLPNRFKKQYEFLEKNSHISVLGTDRVVINNNNEIQKSNPIIALNPSICEWIILFSSPIIHPSAMLRKEDILTVGGYSLDKEAEHAEDIKLWMTLIENGYKITNLSDILLKYRVHGENITAKYCDTQYRNKLINTQKYIENRYGIVVNNYVENLINHEKNYNIELIIVYNQIFDSLKQSNNSIVLKQLHADTIISLLANYIKVNFVLVIYNAIKLSIQYPYLINRLPVFIKKIISRRVSGKLFKS